MRILLGILIGCALTVGGVYIADHTTTEGSARPMVNWDVVGKNVQDLSAFARDSWKRIAG